MKRWILLLILLALPGLAGASIVRGPYLQLSLPDAITIRWRTDTATSARVFYSQDPANQNITADDPVVSKDHSVTLSGLNTNTKYYYKVGTPNGPISARFIFYSAPDDGHELATRLWVIGNSGGKTKITKAVRKAYLNYNGSTYTNLLLFLGDNISKDGSDSQYQSKLFNIFGSLLSGSASLATIGEKESQGSSDPNSVFPYFDVFNLPAAGEGGGVASGTERYYSYNYGTIHFVVLDSMTSDRSPDGQMLQWLNQDLAANKRPWIIAFWHHAPYSKGNHDSDHEIQMMEMRENANQILENYGVDLVLGAHSKDYERSFLIDGNYGLSNTFSTSMELDPGDGRIDGTGPYLKQIGASHNGAVYMVAGTSSGGAKAPLNYPAMYHSSKQPGSVIIDVVCTDLTATFLTKKGQVGDHFTIRKINTPPNISLTAPSEGAHFPAGSDITFTVSTSDAEQNLRRVLYFANREFIPGALVYSPPYTFVWKNVPAGTYSLLAQAQDNMCGNTFSDPVSITVDP